MKFVEFESIVMRKRVSIDVFAIIHVNEKEKGTDIIINAYLTDKKGSEPACISVTEPYDVVMERIRAAEHEV